jgi:hypothetical protein
MFLVLFWWVKNFKKESPWLLQIKIKVFLTKHCTFSKEALQAF